MVEGEDTGRLMVEGEDTGPTRPYSTEMIFASWRREGSSRWKQRSSIVGVTMCVHVPRTCSLRR
jgi:hypothetical protein